MNCQSLARERGGHILVMLLFVVQVSFAAAQAERGPYPSVMSAGEELVYNVRYGFFDLGQVRIQTLREVRTPEYHAYEGKALIDSYASVPLVDVHAVFESVIDSAIFSRRFVSRNWQDNAWDVSRYKFEYEQQRVCIEKVKNDTLVTKRDTIYTEIPLQDGLSLFFYARESLFSRKSHTIPTVIKEEKVNTHINFQTDRMSVEIDAVDYPIDVIRFDGNADFVGFFGLTGDFEGWFSNDGARVPILARLKVIIGSVTVELIQWKRSGWTPPRGEG